jgi:simple sugar transport system ATP-binding protein
VSTLSGGNQQKVVVAREMSRPLRLFIASQPTRGVDVGSIEFIHGRIMHERGVGTAVLVVSSELDEVVGLADRIAVMYRGRVLAIVSPDTPREELGLLMAGVTGPSDAPSDSASDPPPDAALDPRSGSGAALVGEIALDGESEDVEPEKGTK